MTAPVESVNLEEAVLVFAPIGRDAELTRDLLAREAIGCEVCHSIAELSTTLDEQGGGVVLLTEEALDDPDFMHLTTCLERQPAWSDVPVLLFVGAPGSERAFRTIRQIESLRNVAMLDRPIRVAAVLSTVRAAIRSRRRQYELRDLLVALHRARTEAESANRLKDEFLATLSHELRTPLNAILGWTSMLARGQVDVDRLPRAFDALDRNAQAQAQLIADLTDVSRIVTGKLQLMPTALDLGDVIRGAAEAVRPSVEAKRIALTVSEGSPCVVYGDADRLRQVFWNLLSNAVKFSPANGTIRIEVLREGDTATAAVTDSGIGIAREFLPFVFDRFRQADQTTTRRHGGLGLGLSIVKHLAELHGGTVSAFSAGPGQGARFEVRLPIIDTELHPLRQSTLVPSVNLGGRSILVVDDDASTREVLAAALEGAHARVRLAASAAEARTQLQHQPPELIIADLGMPAEDGFTFMRGLREKGRMVPAIALSAYADERSRERARDAGFDVFVAKPTRSEVLLQLIYRLLTG